MALLLSAAAVVPALLWLALVLDLTLVGLAWVDGRRAARCRLDARRAWPPLLVQGTDTEVEVTVTNPGRRALELVLREALDPALASGPLRHATRVPAGAAVRWRYALRPRRRGRHDCGELTVRVLGPWGLAWAQRVGLPAETRRVYPQVRWEGAVGRLLMLAQRHQLGQVDARLSGEGSEPYALREYRPGDPFHTVHWKATARHGRPITRESVLEAGARVVILVDCARAMMSVDGDRSKLDHALAASLALLRVAVARGDRVTVVAFADAVVRTVRVGSGSHAVQEAYEALFDLAASGREPAYDLVVEAVNRLEPRRATVVLMTSVVDLAAAELLTTALLRLELRHRPVLVNLDDPDLGRLAFGLPSSASEAFAKVSALQIAVENKRLARRLRRAGIRVVSAPADRLALETLSSYLSLHGGQGRSPGRSRATGATSAATAG